jgi:hypothetical protein
MHACERLIECVSERDGVMSNDEAGTILYYAQNLERTVIPYCKKRHESSGGPIISGWSK